MKLVCGIILQMTQPKTLKFIFWDSGEMGINML